MDYSDILRINETVPHDDSITNIEYHSQPPFNSSNIRYNDEIRITAQNQDGITLPCCSDLVLSGKLVKTNAAAGAATVPADTLPLLNFALNLFTEVSYYINGVLVDRVQNPGLVATIKHYVCHTSGEERIIANAGFTTELGNNCVYNTTTGDFYVTIPLRFISGFFEDYRKVIINVKQELVLRRSSNDHNAVYNSDAESTETVRVDIDRIFWNMPYVQVSDSEKLKLYKYVQSDKAIELAFRTWELFEYPSLPNTNKHIWNLKTSIQLETPRYVIVAFQTDRNNQAKKDNSKFDHCNIKDLRVQLNNQIYPYNKLDVNFGIHRFGELYAMYAKFQSSYYGQKANPILSPENFNGNAPLFVIDCSKQNERIKSSTVDIKLMFETGANFPANTVAYAIIIHDSIFKYKSLSNHVTKVV